MPGNNSASEVTWTVWQVVLGTLTVAMVTGIVWMLVRWHDVVFLLFVAIVISTAIKPAVDYMQGLGIPRPAGIITVYLVGVILLVSAIVLGAPLMGDQLARIANTIPEAYQNLRISMLQTPNLFIWRLGLALPSELPMAAGAAEATNGNGNGTVLGLRDTIGVLTPVLRGLSGILLTFVLAFYWTVEGERLKRAALLLIPLDRRDEGRDLVASLEAKLGRYIVGQALLMASIAIISLVGYMVIGLPYAFVLALIAGLMEAIPLIGPALGALPAALVAYSVDPRLIIWVIVFTAVIQQLENNILVPRIMRRSVGVNPLVTLLALTALGALFGITGAVVAVPLAAIVQLLFFRYVVERDSEGNGSLEGRDLYSVVRYDAQELVRDMRRQVRARNNTDDDDPQAIVDELEAIAVELNELLAGGNGNAPATETPSAGAKPAEESQL